MNVRVSRALVVSSTILLVVFDAVYFLGPLLNEAAALTMLKAHLQRLLAQGKIEGGDVAAFSYKSGAERPLPRYPPRERREPSRWHE